MHGTRWILATGALLGLGGVIAGSLLDHAAAGLILQQHAADTALRYHQLYALVITALGLVLAYCEIRPHHRRRLRVAASMFIVGTLLFCGSLYALAFTGIASAAYGAPIGGITLMAAWAMLGFAALHKTTYN